MENIKILLSVDALDESFQKMVDSLKSYAQVDVITSSPISLKGYAIYIGKKLSKEELQTADQLKVVFAYKTGVEDFPLQELDERGIALCNSHIDATIIARYAFSLALSLLSSIPYFDSNLRKGIWQNKQHLYWDDLFSKKVGLLGYGHIGKALHAILLQNQIECYTIDRKKKYENINLVSSLDELIATCDVLIVSLPNTSDTTNLLNQERLLKMKDKYFINVGRSNCFDEKRLYESLKEHILKGAAIDTWSNKPKDLAQVVAVSSYPFETLDNIILSPHAAMKVKNGHLNYVMDITNHVIQYLTQHILVDEVDLKKGY